MAERVTKGERRSSIDAASWNEFVDAAEKIKRLPAPAGKAGAVSTLSRALTIACKNTSGADYTADFPIVRLVDPVITPADYANVVHQHLVLEVDDPDATNAHWGVMQGPCVDGKQQQTVVSGYTWATVNVTDASHTTCGPTNNEATKLESGGAGASIVYKPAGTGDLVCLVKLEAAADAGADELRGTVSSYVAAGTASNTYGIIVLKTSPAAVPLPTGSPAISGTVYLADVHSIGSFAENDVVRAIRNTGIDTYNPGGGAVDVNWEHVPTESSGVSSFTCLITSSLTAATWDNANKRLTPAANTDKAILLGWDGANSRYDEATSGTTISPEWVSAAAITVGSGKALIGKGVYADGRYQLLSVDCPESEVTYTGA